MAVVTYTRRQIVDMIPEFLTKRTVGFPGPQAKAAAAEAGLSDTAMGVLSAVLALRQGDLVARSRYAFRSPYAVRRPALEKAWTEIVGAGLAEPVDDGWRLRPRAIGIAQDVSRRLRAHIRALPLPAEPTGRAAGDLSHLAERIPPTAERTDMARRIPLPPEEPRSDAITLNRAATLLWTFRDDCHIGAWQAAGYEGPAFEVLSFVWSSPSDVSWTRIGGHRTIDDLAKALSPRQERADVERNVDALVGRGDLARNGDAVSITPQGQRSRDAIEEDTDRRSFAIWDLDDAVTARLGDDLRTVIDALPKA